jgi:drug/metabolite transporter (DMT)-like permease
LEYVVVLITAVFHAIWNAMVKGSDDRLMSLTMIRMVGLVFGVVVVCTQPAIEMDVLPYVIVASLIHFGYFYCLINAYKFGEFSQVYPISRGVAPLLVLLVGIFVLQEQLTVWQSVGTLLICFGVLLLSLAGGRIQLKPLIFALLTATCIASYTIVSGLGVRLASSFWVYAGWLELFTGLLLICFTVIRRKSHLFSYIKHNAGLGILAGVLSVFGYVAVLWAMTSIAMAPIAALRETSIIFAAIIGVWFFKESFAKHRVAASILVVAGVSFLTLSSAG